MSVPAIHYAPWLIAPSESDSAGDCDETVTCGRYSPEKATDNPKVVTCKHCLRIMACQVKRSI